MAIKNRLKSILAEKNMSQNELADMLGVSKSTISNIISGNQNATLESAIDMANILNVSVEDIFYKPKSEEEASEDFVKLIEQANNIYKLYEQNKFTRKDVVSIYKTLIGNFTKEYDPVIIDLLADVYKPTNEDEEINPILQKLFYGAE